jgi:YbgC/YbaW family acyl-CoA thioester hydrolase
LALAGDKHSVMAYNRKSRLAFERMKMHKRFTIEEHVRWSDIDRAGIIYYGQFLRFFEIAETELFRAVGLSYSEVFDRLDIWLPRVQIHFDFRKPLVLDDLIEVSAYVGRFGTKSLTLRFEVNKKGEPDFVAEGHIILACVSRSTFKGVVIPEEIREPLKPYLADAR